MLHVINARCVARDLHMTAPGPLGCTCWRQFAALWGDCKKTRIAHLNAIIIIIICAPGNDFQWCCGPVSKLVWVSLPCLALMKHCWFVLLPHNTGPGLPATSPLFSQEKQQALKLVVEGFLLVLRFPPLLHQLMVQPIKKKAKINAIYILSIAELSLRTKWQMICCTWQVPDVLHVICTRLRLGHLSVRVGDSSPRSEEIVKKSQIVPFNAIIIIIIITIFECTDKMLPFVKTEFKCT